MKKTRKSLLLLCSATFCFSLALAGCKKSRSSSEDPKSTFTVTFNSNGGSAVAAQTVEAGKKATKPNNPTKAADELYTYSFKAWYEDQALVTEFDFNTLINQNWTLYAGWNQTPKGGDPVTPTPSVTPTPTGTPTPLPSDAPYYAEVGSAMFAFSVNEGATLYPEQEAEYVASIGSVTAGQQLSILDAQKTPLSSEFGAEPSETNNVEGEGNPFTIRSSAQNVLIYLKVWKSGWTNFYVTGYQSGGDPTPTGTPIEGDLIYTVTDNPSWIVNDDAVIFAWIWSASNPGSWEPVTFISDTVLQFDGHEELTGFVLARCYPGTTEPNWAETEQQPGKVWNQTEDCLCQAGVYSYTLTWK